MVTRTLPEIAVRVTRLESFRRYWDEKDDEKAARMETELIRDIKSSPPPNRKMQMGTALHAILGEPHLYYNGGQYVCDGFAFAADAIEHCVRHVQYDALFEQPTYATYPINGTNVLVTGTCDHLRGRVLTDFKTRWFEGAMWGVWDDNKLRESYEASYQWRFYCDMFGADEFRYLIFVMRDREPIELVHIKRDIVCVPYATMRDDLNALLFHFLNFVHVHGLESCLQRTAREQRIIEESFC